MKDIVVDNSVMTFFGTKGSGTYKDLFEWLYKEGVLTTSQSVITEYMSSNQQNIGRLIGYLSSQGRHNKITNATLRAFHDDRHFTYTCNYRDRNVAKTVFLSVRKKLASKDDRLINDVNAFPKVDKIKPTATKTPDGPYLR